MPRKKDSSPFACETLDVDLRNGVGLVALNRPQLHNAFNETLIAELTSVLHALDADASVRAVVLTGHGKSFCAGADLNWMKKMAGYGPEENLADAEALALMLRTLSGLGKPTVACVRGPHSVVASGSSPVATSPLAHTMLFFRCRRRSSA
jgi:methylglutaconyl-CoA hydratase